MRGRDIENQAEGEATRFLSATPLPGPASQQVLKEGSDDQAVLPGPSTAGERKRAGRLRKLITRGPTRFDEHIESGETAEPTPVEPRTRWQRAAAEARTTSRIQGEEFFTRVWPEEQHTPPSSPGFSLWDILSPSRSQEKKEGEIQDAEGAEGESYTLVGPHPCPPTRSTPAVYVPLHLRRDHQRSTLFLPSALPSDLHSKLEEGVNVRDPLEEGLYVGEKPFLTPANRNIVENRLLRQNNRHWFSETGSLERLNTPINEQFYHHLPPHLQGTQSKEPLTVFMGPQPIESLQDCDEGTGGVLDLELCGLHFTHHPLFSPEHVLAAQLTHDYKLYKQRVSLGATRILQAKLVVLRQSLSKLREAGNPTNQPSQPLQLRHKTAREELDVARRLEIYRREVKACREEANVEAEKDRQILTGLLRTWRNIKDLRHSSRVHATSIRLLIRKEEGDHAEEEEQRKVELEEEVREVLDERQQDYEAQSKRYEKELAEWKAEHKKRKEARRRQEERRKAAEEGSTPDAQGEEALIQVAQDDTLLASSEPPRPSRPPKPPPKHKVELEVLEVFSRTRKPPGEPVVSLELTHTPLPEPHNCPDPEKKRRQAVAKIHVWLRVGLT